jgi:hypothetical protein
LKSTESVGRLNSGISVEFIVMPGRSRTTGSEA